MRKLQGTKNGLKNAALEQKHHKNKGRVVLRGDILQDDSGAYAVFPLQGSSDSQMTAAEVMDVIARLPGCAGPAADAGSAYTRVKMEDAPRLLKIPVGMSRYMDTPSTTRMAKILVKHWRSSFSSRTKFVRSPGYWPLVWENIRGGSIASWMGKSIKLGISFRSSKTRIVLIGKRGWCKHCLKRAENGSYAKEIDETCWSWRINTISSPCVFAMHSTWIWSEREYCWREMFESRISATATEKITRMGETSRKNCRVVLHHGRTCSEMRWEILRAGEQKDGGVVQSLKHPAVDSLWSHGVKSSIQTHGTASAASQPCRCTAKTMSNCWFNSARCIIQEDIGLVSHASQSRSKPSACFTKKRRLSRKKKKKRHWSGRGCSQRGKLATQKRAVPLNKRAKNARPDTVVVPEWYSKWMGWQVRLRQASELLLERIIHKRNVNWTTHRIPCMVRQSRIAAKHTSGARNSRGLTGNVGDSRAARWFWIVKVFLLVHGTHIVFKSPDLKRELIHRRRFFFLLRKQVHLFPLLDLIPTIHDKFSVIRQDRSYLWRDCLIKSALHC